MEAKYYNDTSENTARNLQTDEMMVSNMLRALENPVISKLMSEDELLTLCQVIVILLIVEKCHAILKIEGKMVKKI